MLSCYQLDYYCSLVKKFFQISCSLNCELWRVASALLYIQAYYSRFLLLLEVLGPHRSLELFEPLRTEVETLQYNHPDEFFEHLVRELFRARGLKLEWDT